MNKYPENMKKYLKNVKKYLKNVKKYVKISWLRIGRLHPFRNQVNELLNPVETSITKEGKCN